MSDKEKMLARLFGTPGQRLVDLKLTRGDGPCTEDQIWHEMNRAFEQEARGEALISTTFPDERPTVNVREFLASL